MKSYKTLFVKFLFIFSLTVASFGVAFASTTDGTIDATYHSALLCTNDACSTNTKINFKTTLGTPVHITDTAITGDFWSEAVGWIRFNPSGGFGGVINTSSGVVSGYAWGDTAGWINFKPTQGGVTINTTGQFAGWAWSENYGWIKFDCSVTDACVTTDWRPLSVRGGGSGTTGGSSGGGGGGNADVCPNIAGTQFSVPSGYVLSGGNCVTPSSDLCPNITGIQSTIPSGYLLLNGDCILPPTDLCPNITGVQVTVPVGRILSEGECILSHVDLCPNIVGTQSTIPAGRVLIDGDCVLPVPEEDACSNIAGTQISVPAGYVLLNGECVPQNFCDLHPTDESCVAKSFCELHPTDPSCATAPLTFCETNPTDPSCVGGKDSTFCKINPTDPSCVSQGNNPDNKTGGNNLVIPAITQVSVDNVVEGARKSIKKIMDTPAGSATSSIISTTGAISGATISIATVLFANPLSFGELFLIPFRLWSLLLAALGLKKRNRPWGTVYDSVTKQPLDPAYVTLEDLDGKEVASSITDLDGRYGFLVPPGQYRMTAKKTNYSFPSTKLAGRTSDELYPELYFSEIINLQEGGVISKNIPMDSLKFDWNEFAKKDKNIMRFFSKRDLWIARISNILFIFGFIITVVAAMIQPATYNIIILIIYLILLVLKRTIMKPRAYGFVNNKITQNPLSFAIMRIFYAGSENEVIHKVTDQTGKYYCLVPNGNYYAKIENKNDDQSYTLVHVSKPIEVKNGYISEKFEI